MEGCRPIPRSHLDFSRNREFMIGAVDGENSVNADRGLPLKGYLSLDLIRTECNFRIAVTLQNFFVHFAVAHSVAALAAFGIHYDLAGQFARSSSQVQRTFLQMKCSVNGVQHIA